MPYAQLGWLGERGFGGWVTEGFVHSLVDSAHSGFFFSHVIRDDGLASTITLQIPRENATLRVFATYVAGRRPPANCAPRTVDDCGTLKVPWATMLGMTFVSHWRHDPPRRPVLR
jgi:hypothetical protein